MNVTDTELENKRKQAINDLVADSTTLAERLLKAESFGDTIRILRNHGHYSSIPIADKDVGIPKITYSDTVEETAPEGPHKMVPFNFGYGPSPATTSPRFKQKAPLSPTAATSLCRIDDKATRTFCVTPYATSAKYVPVSMCVIGSTGMGCVRSVRCQNCAKRLPSTGRPLS